MRAGTLLMVAGSLILAVSACRPVGTPAPEPGAIDTAVAQTVQVRLSSEALSETPSPQATNPPLAESSDTPKPADTAALTAEPATDTPTFVPSPVPATDTPVPVSTLAPATSAVPTTVPATETSGVPTLAPPTETPVPVATTVEPPTETPTQQPTAPPGPACSLPVSPQFGSRLEAQPDALLALGCPSEPERETWAAEQRYQFGGMLWQQDLDAIHIVYGNGNYQFVPDQWVEGDPDYLCPEQEPPPAGLVMPKRGFGWLWCNTPAVQAGLGWALEEEQGYQAVWQDFVQGRVLHNREGVLFVFYDDGTWDSIG